jgi:hypothetical protein
MSLFNWKWNAERKRKREMKLAYIELFTVVSEHLSAGGAIADLSAYAVAVPVRFDPSIEEWMIVYPEGSAIETAYLEDGDRVYLVSGRGGVDEFATVVGSGVDGNYVVVFDAGARAGLDG